MKTFLLFFCLLFSFSSLAMEPDFHPLVALGHRFGEEDLNDNNEFYASFKVTLLGQKLNSTFNELNFLTPGINLQGDGKLALSLSPISITMLNSLTFGLDLFLKEDNVNGGNWGVFIGIRF